MDFSFIAYIFVCIALCLGVFTQLFNSGRLWTGIICLVLFLLIFVFYGIRWFRGDKSVFSYSGSWPPIINMCPDYLVYFKRPLGNNRTEDTCVDLSGVAKGGSSLKQWTQDDNPQNPPGDDDKYFKYVFKTGADDARMKLLCQKTMEAGLTWEGITNGESCTFTSPTKVLG
jgi:hypothetical protein